MPKPEREPEPAENRAADRKSLVVRPGAFLTLVILSCFAMGLAIYWLLRSMHI